MPVSRFNDSRMVGATRCANSKVVGMSFLERIWQKKFSKSSLKVATSLIKLLNPGLTSFRKSLNEHNRFLAFSFPFCVFCVFPYFPCWYRQQHSDDSLITLIVMYFNNSLTIWNTKMNAIDKEKNLSNRLIERAGGSCKEENMIRKAAKSSKGVMHWTRQSNEMNNQNSSKNETYFCLPLLNPC